MKNEIEMKLGIKLNENKDKWESLPNTWYVMQIQVSGKSYIIKV